MRHKYIIIFLCLLISQLTSAAITFNYRNHLSGLSGESVYCFFKDSKGIMWIGSNQGVSAYNGDSFHNFDIINPTPLSIVKSIAEMPDGTILVGSYSGLYIVDKQHNRCSQICPEIKDVSSICIIGSKALIGSSQGIWIYEKDQTTQSLLIENNIISKSNAINDMVYDGKNSIWVVTNDNLVHLQWPQLKMTKYPISKSLLTGSTNTISLAGNKVFIGTQNSGIIQFNPQDRSLSHYNTDIKCNVISDLNSNLKNLLYVSTDGNGAYVIDVNQNKIVESFNQNNEHSHITNNSVYTFWFDEQLKIFWIGFFLDGFCHNYPENRIFDTYKFKDFDSRGLSVRSFMIRNDERIIGTRNGLYFISEGRHIVKYFPPEEINANIITSIQFFSGKYVIATYDGGLLQLDPITLQISNVSESKELQVGRFSRIVTSPDQNTLFALCDLGIYLFDKEFNIKRCYTSKNSELPDAYLNDMVFDKQGKGWIGTMSKLALYDPTTGTIISHDFPKNYFNNYPELNLNLCENGDLFAFSRDKVFLTKPDLSKYKTIELYEQLNVGEIFFITESPDNKYWVGTDRGLFLFDHDFNKFRQFYETDGLPSLKFNKNEYQWSGDTLWIANTRGLVYITPDFFKRIRTKKNSQLTLNKVLINGLPVGSEYYQLNSNKYINISWNFTSDNIMMMPLELNYGRPYGRYYEWSLDDSSYLPVADGEFISLSHLSLGKHTLKIRIAGLQETETSYIIGVYPNTVFYLETFIVILIFITFYLLTRLRKKKAVLKNALKRKHQLELKIMERNTIERMKDEETLKKKNEEEARIQSMYHKAKLSNEEYEALYKKVRTYVQKEKAYTNSELHLSDIAHAIGCPTAHLSQMFNIYTQQNFFDFINTYRIEEFKRCIKDKSYNQYTITAISEMCGFKRSTFFSVFKKFENCTPTEYLQKNKLERKKKSDNT